MDDRPQEILRMSELVKTLRSDYPALDNHYDLAFVQSQIDASCWGWSPIFKYLPPEQIDRTGDVFNGPVFTCEGYEWPMHENLPMNPIIQLDLGRCSEVSGQDLGNGLLQVWEGYGLLSSKDAYLRLIPSDVVKSQHLQPIPQFDMDSFDEWITITWKDWADTRFSTEEGGEANMATQIVGYESRKFTLPRIYKVSESCAPSVLKELPEACLALIGELDELIQVGQEKWRTGTHLMGTFSRIQYYPSRRPTPLFCIETDNPRVPTWCFTGNGQIFMDRKSDGKIEYSIDWSCS